MVLTADCAPVAIADDDAVGVVHAGWQGLLGRAWSAAAVAALRAIGPGRVRAALGPCIRPAHYEFGRADLDRMVARFGPTVEGRTAAGHPRARRARPRCGSALAEVGVDDVDDTGLVHRGRSRAAGSRTGVTAPTGRQAVVVVVKERR